MSFLQVDVINMATLRCYLTMLYKTSEKKGRTFVGRKSATAKELTGIAGTSMRSCRHEHAQLLVPSPTQSPPRQLTSQYVCSHVSIFTNREWVKISYIFVRSLTTHVLTQNIYFEMVGNCKPTALSDTGHTECTK